MSELQSFSRKVHCIGFGGPMDTILYKQSVCSYLILKIQKMLQHGHERFLPCWCESQRRDQGKCSLLVCSIYPSMHLSLWRFSSRRLCCADHFQLLRWHKPLCLCSSVCVSSPLIHFRQNHLFKLIFLFICS